MNILQTALSHPLAAGGGIAIGIPVAALAARASSFIFTTCWNWLFTKRSLQDSLTVDTIAEYLSKNCKSFGIKDDRYEAFWRYVPRLKKNKHVFYIKTGSSHRCYIYNGAPIIFKPTRSESNASSNITTMQHFTFLRGTVNWHKLLIDSAKYADTLNDEKDKNLKNYGIWHYTGTRRNELKSADSSAPAGSPPGVGDGVHKIPIGWSQDDFKLLAVESSMKTLSITPSMQRVIDDFEFWKTSREWYSERGVPWRWGCLLYGVPGTGKTSTVRLIAEHFDVPVCIFELSSMDNHDFIDSWNRAKQIPCQYRIVLLEDFDTTFHGRKNIVKNSDLSFETILNAIGGIERENGLALFVTTNHVEHIDPALGCPNDKGESTRPGRIDLVVEIEVMDHAGKVKIANRILRDSDLAEKMALEHKEDTAASFEDHCMTMAKKMLWAGRRG